MKVFVTVKAGSKNSRIEAVDAVHFKVWVKAPPVEGKANAALVEILSEYFDVPKSSVVLTRGGKAKQKTFKIERLSR